MAKALRLGADYCGVALPLLRAAFERGYEGVRDRLLRYIRELRIALFLTGSRTTEELRRRPVVIRGDLKEWVEWRGLRV